MPQWCHIIQNTCCSYTLSAFIYSITELKWELNPGHDIITAGSNKVTLAENQINDPQDLK